MYTMFNIKISLPFSSLDLIDIVPVSEEDSEEARDIGLVGGELKTDVARESLLTIAPPFSLSWAITSLRLASSSTGKMSTTMRLPH